MIVLAWAPSAQGLHQIDGFDLGPAGDLVVEPTPTTTRTTTTTATTSSATTAATSRSSTVRFRRAATTATAPSARPIGASLVLREDGRWLLPAVDVPVEAGAILEDLVWFRFEGDGFGRSRGWSGRVALVSFAPDGPCVAVRCSSTRRDGVMAYHDGHEWQQTGALLRSGVDYLLRTVFRPEEGQADIYLIEPGAERPSIEPMVSGPTASQPTTQTTQPSTTQAASAPARPISRAYAIRPLLTTGRQVQIAAAVRCAPLTSGTVRRAFVVSGGPMFDTIIRRWQLWHATKPPEAAVTSAGGHDVATLSMADAAWRAGRVCFRGLASGGSAATFRPQVGLVDDLRSSAGWVARAANPVMDEQGGPVLAIRGLGTTGDGVGKAFRPPRVPFDVRVCFKLPPDTPPMRTIDLVRFVRSDTRSTVGPYVQLLAGAQDLGAGKWAARLAAQVGTPQPVIDANPVHPDTWYELRLNVDPVNGTYTAALVPLGKDRPDALYTPATRPAAQIDPAKPNAAKPAKPPAAKPEPKPLAVFGSQPQKFLGLSRLPAEMSLVFEAEGAYRPAGQPVELNVRPSIVLPLPDNTRPWTNPATMADMTYRDGRLEILSTHGGGGLLTVDTTDGTVAFVEKAFGTVAGKALAWDRDRACYWWTQPTGKFLLERRDPDRPAVSTFLPAATTQPTRPFPIVAVPGPITIDGKLDDWNRAGGCGPLADNVAKIGQQDATLWAMYDAAGLYLAAEVHDPDPLVSVSEPAGNRFNVGDLVTFRFRFDPSAGPASGPTTRPESAAAGTAVHFWVNHKQKRKHIALIGSAAASRPTTASRPATTQGVQLEMIAWPDKDARGKGYTLEAVVPWRSLTARGAPKSGDTVGFAGRVLWGDASGTKAVASVTAHGLSGPDGQPARLGTAVFLPENTPPKRRWHGIVPLHGDGQLAASSSDVFSVSPSKGIYRWRGKTGPPVAFDYRQAFDAKLLFAGVAADAETLLLAGPYGAPNAAVIYAVHLASGRPIQRFSLAKHVKGVTALADDGETLYALAAADRVILSCNWPGRESLGLTQPVLLVGRVEIRPVRSVDRLALIAPDAKMANLGGTLKRVKDAKTGTERFEITQAMLQYPTPTFVLGDTLGEFRTMRVRACPSGAAQVLQITMHPKPVGKPRSVYLAALDSKSAATRPASERRTTARAFFGGAEFVPDAKSPLRQFKPDRDDEPVVLLPVGVGPVDVTLDMVADFGLGADTWVGQIALRSVGPPCTIERLSVAAADAVHDGPADGMLVGDVIDLGAVGCELLDWQSDLTPPDRQGDELRLWIRSANDRTELSHLAWRQIEETGNEASDATSRPTASAPTTSQAMSGRPGHPLRLGRFVQWRVDLETIHTHEPPTVSTVRMVLAGVPRPRVDVVGSDTQRALRRWWPVIFAVPIACCLIWFAFLRRKKRAEDATPDRKPVRKGRYRSVR